MSQFFCKLRRDTNPVKNVAIHRCIDDGYGLIQIFTEKIRIPPQEIVACLRLVAVQPPVLTVLVQSTKASDMIHLLEINIV